MSYAKRGEQPRCASVLIFDTVLPVTTLERTSGSLAAWYRPRRFAEVAGQRHVTAILKRQIAGDRLPTALLFSGASGLGKTTLARVTAAARLCETPMDERGGDACGICETCLDITVPGRVHPDVIEFDAASNGGKDEIRAIAERSNLMPMRAAKKIYIIDEAHGLSGPGGQAFLKLLEEPPPHVIFMLATTDPEKMLPTNRGRCTEYELLAPTKQEMVANLERVAEAEGWPLTEDTAEALVEASDPALGVRATLMSLEKVSVDLDEGEILTPADISALLHSASRPLLDALIATIDPADPREAFDALAVLRGTTTDSAIFDGLATWARNLLLTGPVADFALNRYRLATLIEGPRTPGQLELAIARLLSPATPDVLEALVARAEALVQELSSRVPAPTDPSSNAHSSSTPRILTPADQNPAIQVTLRDPEQFIAAVALEMPRIAGLLRTATLTLTPNALRITTTADTRDALKEDAAKLRAVAESFGVKLTISVPRADAK